MQTRRDEQNKSNQEAMKRMDSSQPTPTQEENDLAKLGVMVDEKEPDGSGPTIIVKTIVANEPLGSTYETRSVQANREAREKVAGRRPGKAETDRQTLPKP